MTLTPEDRAAFEQDERTIAAASPKHDGVYESLWHVGRFCEAIQQHAWRRRRCSQ